MNRKAAIALLLASGAVATPAHANFFHNPFTGINLNIGSAPNPTPADIREDRLPVVTQDDSKAAPVAEAGKSSTKAIAPVAQNQTQPAGEPEAVAAATQPQ